MLKVHRRNPIYTANLCSFVVHRSDAILHYHLAERTQQLFALLNAKDLMQLPLSAANSSHWSPGKLRPRFHAYPLSKPVMPTYAKVWLTSLRPDSRSRSKPTPHQRAAKLLSTIKAFPSIPPAGSGKLSMTRSSPGLTTLASLTQTSPVMSLEFALQSRGFNLESESSALRLEQMRSATVLPTARSRHFLSF